MISFLTVQLTAGKNIEVVHVINACVDFGMDGFAYSQETHPFCRFRMALQNENRYVRAFTSLSWEEVGMILGRDSSLHPNE